MKNIDYINKKVANTLDIDEGVVKKINTFYWQSFMKAMHSYETPSVFIKGLGNFYIPLKGIRHRLYKTLAKLKWQKANFEDHKNDDRYIKTLNMFHKLWKIKKELDLRYAKKEN